MLVTFQSLLALRILGMVSAMIFIWYPVVLATVSRFFLASCFLDL